MVDVVQKTISVLSMEGTSLSIFAGSTWGADSTSPQPQDDSRQRTIKTENQSTSSGNNHSSDDRKLHVNSIRGSTRLSY
ncbi:hypothetical protein M0802_012370 [Mischocyttarus mexicanus]|nr:hypothetical protein M0802_012370 [Mischocyttarus mexicanus]